MEFLALALAGLAVFLCLSTQKSIAKLDERIALNREELDRAIRQLQDNGLSVADREMLDRLHSAAAQTRQREREADDA